MGTPHGRIALGFAPDRAIRDRILACLLDGIAVGILTRLLVPGLGIHGFGGGLIAVLVIQFLYFFVQEASGGQTVAKRARGLRVVQMDGSTPTLQQIAIRNALRPFDALPMFYASGLVAVMWSGPGRRQRMGDRVAETSVVLEPGRTGRAEGDKLLPALTIAAVLLSIILYGLIYDEYRTPGTSANGLIAPTVAGFAGDNTQKPSPGLFTATPYVNGVPGLDPTTRQPATRSWQISQRCSSAGCTFVLARDVPGLGQEAGDMSSAADGWHVTFPTHGFKTFCLGSSTATSAFRRSTLVIHFDPGGATAEAHEATHFHSKTCGDFTRALDWTARQAHF